jgi:hypothetical protein
MKADGPMIVLGKMARYRWDHELSVKNNLV